ncbi:MAG: phosphoenolpyruvate--protein phosphotransferase [Lautropia sp.]|nr:phosphoenolpyruvate--protein phosphotransferase [Lautropia sp.]
MMQILCGAAIGGGIVVGHACVLETGFIDVPRYYITADEVPREHARLDAGCAAVEAELQGVAAQLPSDAPAEARALLDVQLMLLHDAALIDAARSRVVQGNLNIEWAISETAEGLAAQFRAIEDPYLKERGRDVEQVAERLLKVLSGSNPSAVSQHTAGEPLIYVAQDLQPADMLQLRGALGFVFEQGGIHSHSAILARSMQVAAVAGIGGATASIADGDLLVLDGDAGQVIIRPDETVLQQYRTRQQQAAEQERLLSRLADVACLTRDGCQVSMLANIEQPEEAGQALRVGAEGIGLFRSEFLFLNRSRLPDEEEQYRAYRQVLQAMQGRPVTIRTIDVGADKLLSGQALMSGATSALGRRAIRYSLAEPEMFLVQLRALLRASAHGTLQILLPMLTQPQEVDEAFLLLAQARQELHARGEPMADSVPVGGMIEVPAAALSAAIFANKLDFLAIGTNDLVQYTLAIDRTDHRIAHLYDELHPAVLRLIALTIRAARKAGKPVCVCGEIAGEYRAAPLLLGMGLRAFSMPPARLLRVKDAVLKVDTCQLTPLVRRMLAQDDLGTIRRGLACLGMDPSAAESSMTGAVSV